MVSALRVLAWTRSLYGAAGQLDSCCSYRRGDRMIGRRDFITLQPCGRSWRARSSPNAAPHRYLTDPEGGSRNAALRGSGPPEKVFNELWKPSRGRLGARRGCKVLDDHKAVDLSLQVGV